LKKYKGKNIDLKKGFCELLKKSELKETNVQVLNSENEKITKELNWFRSELNVRKIEIL
jgi:archaellum component FlaC